MYVDDVILTDEDIIFDIGNELCNTDSKLSATESIIYTMVCWYCKKFKVKSNDLTIKDMKKMFKKYAIHWLDGIWISPITYGFSYTNE